MITTTNNASRTSAGGSFPAVSCDTVSAVLERTTEALLQHRPFHQAVPPLASAPAPRRRRHDLAFSSSVAPRA